MFDKSRFSQILKNINETYDSQRDFSKRSGINRTYLSQYMNLKLEDPPKPKILEKLSHSSHGITTYEELMNVCGYININKKHSSIPVYATNDKKNRKINFLIDLTRSNNLSSVESEAFNELTNTLIDCLKNDKKIDIDYILNCKKYLYNKLNSNEKNNVLEYIKPLIAEINYVETEYGNTLNITPLSGLQQIKIPILGTVKAGYDYLVDENRIGHIYLDYIPSDPENYYALQVTGNSMEPLFDNGDIAIVHKQDDFDSGNTCIVLINGDEATVKKVILTEDGIDLIAMNPYYPVRHFTKEEMKKIPVQIIGKVVEARKRKQFE